MPIAAQRSTAGRGRAEADRRRVQRRRARRASRRSRRRSITTSRPSSTTCASSSRASGASAAQLEFVHFACTSEDINNLAYALMLRDARAARAAAAHARARDELRELAHRFADVPMLARTHGQPATPTTLGKELANFVCAPAAAERAVRRACRCYGKFNGAVGNFNAHVVAYPGRRLARDRAPLRRLARSRAERATRRRSSRTTGSREYCQALARFNTVLDRPVPRPLGLHLLGLLPSARRGRRSRLVDDAAQGESDRLRERRRQPRRRERAAASLRGEAADLALAARPHRLDRAAQRRRRARPHADRARRALKRGLGKLDADPARIAADLDEAWEVLAEAVQTVMRAHGVPDGYEQLKDLTRGRRRSRRALREFIAYAATSRRPNASACCNSTPRLHRARRATRARHLIR